jgi:hypothetical protein
MKKLNIENLKQLALIALLSTPLYVAAPAFTDFNANDMFGQPILGQPNSMHGGDSVATLPINVDERIRS